MPCAFTRVGTAMSILLPFALLLSPVLSPEAVELNAKAMHFYDAGQLAPAVDHFFAAYQAMPDARRDLAGRQQLIGSMRGTLLDLHDQTGEAAPLCRLQSLLRGHAEALLAAFPEAPDRPEITHTRYLHLDVTRQLAALGPDVCAPPPAPPPPAPAIVPVAERPEPPAPAPAPAPATPPTDDPRPRRLQIAGGVILPIGVVALGVLGALASRHNQNLARADTLYAELATRTCTDADRTRLHELQTATRHDERLMLALGLTGGALVTAGTALLVRGSLQRRRARLGLDLRQHRVGFAISGEF